MRNVRRPAAFVLVSSNHGTLIVNRNDYHQTQDGRAYGVGLDILCQSGYGAEEIELALGLLESRRANYGSGVVALDCGANVGVHTVEWARCMSDWGRVLAFEPQEKIYYALAGNIAINNCLNAEARLAAVGAACGRIRVPQPDYAEPASFGSLELKPRPGAEDIGQRLDAGSGREVELLSVDSLGLERLDFMKIDVEGMELEVLEGAARSIAAHRPQILVETLKSDAERITHGLTAAGYETFPAGMNLLAVHREDPLVRRVRVEAGAVTLAQR